MRAFLITNTGGETYYFEFHHEEKMPSVSKHQGYLPLRWTDTPLLTLILAYLPHNRSFLPFYTKEELGVTTENKSVRSATTNLF